MATTPRRKSNRTTASTRAKKPTTIDLDAVEVEAGGEVENSDVKKQPTPKRTRAAAGRTRKTPENTARTTPKPTPKVDNDTAEPAPEAISAKPSGASEMSDNRVNNSSGGFGKLLAAGIFGSAITLGGAGYMQYAGYLPSLIIDNNKNETQQPIAIPDLEPLKAKIAELRTKFENQPAPKIPTVDLSPLEGRLANVENSLANSLSALSEAETSLAILNANSDSGVNLRLAEEMAGLKSDLNKLRSSNRQLAIKMAVLPESGTNEAFTNDNISDLVTPLLSPLTKAKDENQQQISQLKNQIVAITGRIDEELISRIDQIDTKLKNVATGERLAKSVAINALKSTLENGEPYSSALASVETLTGTLAPLEQLRATAASGIASTKSLLTEFQELQSRILLTASSNGEAGLSERMMLSLKSLVTISSDKPLAGNTPEAIVSRIEAGLKTGKLSEALVEWNSLPDPAKTISKSWADSLKQRSHADQQMIELMKSIQSSTTSG